ncbi:alpha-L-rhamnosidase C-terminal domain-containing protein [Alistipes senegalensis]|uniref:alpha-L-rhamnosidase C-terminal domain-containing protein n=1 Tax=Alistipes senegalensis TaxID=1288121 RepID=UPI00374255D1
MICGIVSFLCRSKRQQAKAPSPCAEALFRGGRIPVPTVAGDIRVPWRPVKRGCELQLAVPGETTACVSVPGKAPCRLRSRKTLECLLNGASGSSVPPLSRMQ